MTKQTTEQSLPLPPKDLAWGDVRLSFVRIVPAEPSRGFVPYYHFRVLLADGSDAGHMNFRMGDKFMEEVPVSPQDPHYERGSRIKRRYEWAPEQHYSERA